MHMTASVTHCFGKVEKYRGIGLTTRDGQRRPFKKSATQQTISADSCSVITHRRDKDDYGHGLQSEGLRQDCRAKHLSCYIDFSQLFYLIY